MNYNHLRAFYLIAKEGNISNAAKILGVTQPALSRIISSLEEHLNTTLFIRLKTGVKLTKSGKDLFNLIKNPYGELDKIEEIILKGSSNKNIPISIGATSMAMEGFLFKHLEKLKNKFPQVTFRIFTNNSKEIIQMVEDKKVDIAFITTPYEISNEIEVINVQELENILIAPISYKDKIKGQVSIKDLKNYPFILLNNETTFRQQLDQFFKDNNVEINASYEPDSSSLLLQFVENDCGLTFIPKGMIQDSLKNNKIFEVNLKERLATRHISFLMLKDKSHLSLIDEIKKEIINYK
jgi:DNA-binding transcriptional LysR family regulator